ncbi:MFS transporter [Paenibacillus sp. MBLB2552]|uniref:MFS transporter n=1 Tax=Paenibacillus mellifer TaxID=2937794 RepID=A0A9X1Y2G6_9BACL|nr:MFS transporter [Paenibacillus mellifer]MCK8489256.1 MFS transporter [Paenibacillus mellifer]
MPKTKWLLNTLVLICFMDLFIQLPVMGPLALSLGAGSFQIGLAVGMYSLTNMIGNMLAGIWIDRFGGKKILITGLLMTAGILLLYTVVRQPSELMAVRVLHGLSGGLLVPSVFTMVSRVTSARNQGRSMAQSGAAVGVAAILGPAFAGIMKASAGLDWLFVSASALLLLGGGLALFGKLRESGGASDDQDASSSHAKQVFIDTLRNPSAATAYYGAFALMFAMGALTYSLPLKAEALGLPDQAAGLMLSVFGVVAISLFVLPSNRWFDQASPLRLCAVGGGIVILSLFALSMTDLQVGMYGVMAVYGLGFALLFPSLNALLVSQVRPEHKGRAFGMFYAFFSLGVVAGSSGLSAFTGEYDFTLRIASGFLLVTCGGVGIWVTLKRRREQKAISPSAS